MRMIIGKIRLTANSKEDLEALILIEKGFHGGNVTFTEPAKGRKPTGEWLSYGEIAYPAPAKE